MFIGSVPPVSAFRTKFNNAHELNPYPALFLLESLRIEFQRSAVLRDGPYRRLGNTIRHVSLDLKCYLHLGPDQSHQM